ncbi:hypothetical protein [Novosphingobium profundi]|uniref:hypothetical protein n=1 Tax=Novosphingobium profundi TaxID=1774954 RepID=UPI001FE96D56|nr:hypothetical protein [Novosphingobium profundi]
MSKFLRVQAAGPLAMAALASLLLAGCGGSKEPTAPSSDPAVSGALGDDIMVDPQMAGQDGAALSADDGAITLPPQDLSAETIADARKKAAALAGGALKPAPQPGNGGLAPLSEGAATAAQVAKAAQLAHTDCTAKLDFSNTWAAKLPKELPVYPRGAVQEAAGIDKDGCAMIVVNYATAMSPSDVLSFYYTLADKVGYTAQVARAKGQYAIGGRKGGKAYVVYVNKVGSSAVTEVNLVTSGK